MLLFATTTTTTRKTHTKYGALRVEGNVADAYMRRTGWRAGGGYGELGERDGGGEKEKATREVTSAVNNLSLKTSLRL